MFTSRTLTAAVRTGAAPRAPLFAAASRAYASAAPTSSNKPPIALFGIDGTYASALYTAASKTSTLEPTAKSLETLANVFKRDAKLASVLAAPSLTPTDKEQIVAELRKHLGNQDREGVVKNLLETLASNNRLGVLEGVAEKYAQLMSAHRGEIELVVTSAAPLDNRTLSRLESAVTKSQYVNQGQKLKVVPKVNPDIRGGLIVEIGDRTIDLSVSAKMAKMNKLLNDTL